jgi:hypothetical protein
LVGKVLGDTWAGVSGGELDARVRFLFLEALPFSRILVLLLLGWIWVDKKLLGAGRWVLGGWMDSHWLRIYHGKYV